MTHILVTGAAGYIGSVLARQLLDAGYAVRGVDALFFGGESLLGIYHHPRFSFLKGDLRDESMRRAAIDGCDAIVHLAAIVGDPACAKQPDLARAINWDASKALFDLAAASGHVTRFVFASTCSNYGKMTDAAYVHEDSPLRPVSLYAELKVQFEEYLLSSQSRAGFVPTALRFATVYGVSPRMRFDLTVNEFMRDVAMGKELVIFGEHFWRPYCHVDDLARSCRCVLESDADAVDHRVFNVGDTNENYTKKMIADEIVRIVPDARIAFVHKTEDPRDYKVNFARIKDELGFAITKTVPRGLREVHTVIADSIIGDPFAPQYKNI